MNSLSPGTVIFGIVAIMASLMSAYGVQKMLEEKPQPVAEQPAPPSEPTVRIVVPTKNLPEYSLISPADVTTVEFPIGSIPEEILQNRIESRERAYYRVSSQTIMANQPITKDMLYEIGKVPTIGERLNPGETALTLVIPAERAANGMVRPNTFVNVQLTLDKTRHPSASTVSTITLMKNVRVLSTSFSRLPTEEKAGELDNVTVAVTPVQANKLNLAQQMGTICLTLNAIGEADESTIDTPSDLTTAYSLLGLDEPTPPGPPKVELPGTKYTDVWINGRRDGRQFTEWEVLESINATRVANGQPPLDRVPRVTVDMDKIPETVPVAGDSKVEARRTSVDPASSTAPSLEHGSSDSQGIHSAEIQAPAQPVADSVQTFANAIAG